MDDPTFDEILAEIEKLAAKIEERVRRGMSRDKALMLSVMEMGGKITVIKVNE